MQVYRIGLQNIVLSLNACEYETFNATIEIQPKFSEINTRSTHGSWPSVDSLVY